MSLYLWRLPWNVRFWARVKCNCVVFRIVCLMEPSAFAADEESLASPNLAELSAAKARRDTAPTGPKSPHLLSSSPHGLAAVGQEPAIANDGRRATVATEEWQSEPTQPPAGTSVGWSNTGVCTVETTCLVVLLPLVPLLLQRIM